jgi:hypothetical protein
MIQKFVIPFTLLFMVASSSESGADCTKNCINWNNGGQMLRGSGKVVTETRRVDKFNAVSVVSVGSVQLERAGTTSVSVSADDNLISLFTTEVKGGTLYLNVVPGKSFQGTGPLYKITVADLRSIEIPGTGDVTADKLAEDRLSVKLSGDGSVRLVGRANELVVDVEGSGHVEAQNLAAKRARVSISGTGSVSLGATDELDARISGVGDVTYTGSPKLTQRITGVGTVSRK